jgi:3-hydroxybutyryl-CoA dehydrogenase
VLGVHFFNPAPVMPLVEIIPALTTDESLAADVRALVDGWGKVTVMASDTPGFIVNRIARPFYGEALRIREEQIADCATIDWAMRELGGFRMGPFELMDFIGNDVNYAVTCSVFEAMSYDPRYKPALTQRRLVEARWLGRKSGRGYYDYREGATPPAPVQDVALVNGDFYSMGLRQALTVESSIHVAFVQDVTTYRFVARGGGIPLPTSTYAYKVDGAGNKVDPHSPFVTLDVPASS